MAPNSRTVLSVESHESDDPLDFFIGAVKLERRPSPHSSTFWGALSARGAGIQRCRRDNWAPHRASGEKVVRSFPSGGSF